MNAIQFAQSMGALPVPRLRQVSPPPVVTPQPQVSAPLAPAIPPRFLPPGVDFKRIADALGRHTLGIDEGLRDIRLLASQVHAMCEGIRVEERGEILVIDSFAACCLATVEHINFNLSGLFMVGHDIRKIPGAR